MTDNKTCAGCRHWFGPTRNAANLGAPRVAECRAQPPQLLIIPVQGGAKIVPQHPQLPENWPACGLHVGHLEVNGVVVAPMEMDRATHIEAAVEGQ